MVFNTTFNFQQYISYIVIYTQKKTNGLLKVIEKLYHIMLYRNFILFQNIANLNHINQGHYKIYNKLLLTFVGCIWLQGKASSGDITKDDLDSCGNLVCGIDSAALSRLDSDALDEYATQIDKCPLGSTERRTLGSTLMTKLDL